MYTTICISRRLSAAGLIGRCCCDEALLRHCPRAHTMMVICVGIIDCGEFRKCPFVFVLSLGDGNGQNNGNISRLYNLRINIYVFVVLCLYLLEQI